MEKVISALAWRRSYTDDTAKPGFRENIERS